MAIDITYADKDKTQPLGTGPRTWRDEDANEVKSVINNYRAHLDVNGLVPLNQLPDQAKTIFNATDFNNLDIENGFVVYWDAGTQKFRTKAPGGGGSDVNISGNTDIFVFDKVISGDQVTLLVGLLEQLPGYVLVGVSGGAPVFRRLTSDDVDGLDTLVLDGVIQKGTVSVTGSDVTVDGTVTSWVWRIDGSEYTRATSQVFNLTPPASGEFRYDQIVGNTLGEYQLVSGTPSTDAGTALIPDIPENTIGLTTVFLSDSGIDSFEAFALSAFVRFDIEQGLNEAQKDTARLNTGALARNKADTHTGALTQNGTYVQNSKDWTLNGDNWAMNGRNWVLTFPNDTNSATSFTIKNNNSDNPGGFYMTERGSVILRAKGDSVSDYYIIRFQGSDALLRVEINNLGIFAEQRSNSAKYLTRRDELYLSYHSDITGAGKLNDVPLTDGIGMLIFSFDVTEVSGIVANGDQKELLVWTDNPNGLLLTGQDVDSLAANRFIEPVLIPSGRPIKLFWKSGTDRWVKQSEGTNPNDSGFVTLTGPAQDIESVKNLAWSALRVKKAGTGSRDRNMQIRNLANDSAIEAPDQVTGEKVFGLDGDNNLFVTFGDGIGVVFKTNELTLLRKITFQDKDYMVAGLDDLDTAAEVRDKLKSLAAGSRLNIVDIDDGPVIIDITHLEFDETTGELSILTDPEPVENSVKFLTSGALFNKFATILTNFHPDQFGEDGGGQIIIKQTHLPKTGQINFEYPASYGSYFHPIQSEPDLDYSIGAFNNTVIIYIETLTIPQFVIDLGISTSYLTGQSAVNRLELTKMAKNEVKATLDPFTIDALRAHYAFEETGTNTVTDSSPQENNGSFGSISSITWEAGPVGNAVILPGTLDRYVTVPHNSSLNITEKITMLAWIRPSALATKHIIAKGTDYELFIHIDGKIELRLNRSTDTIDYQLYSITDYPIDGVTWMHVAAYYYSESGVAKIFINGVEDATATFVSKLINTNTSPLTVAATLVGENRWVGGIDEVKLYSRVLTDSEILADYNLGV